jgi:hypothetical protein
MGKEKGVGPYAGNDVKLNPDPRIDESGNYRAAKREQSDSDIERNSDYAKRLPKK